MPARPGVAAGFLLFLCGLAVPRTAAAQYSPVHRGSIQLGGTASFGHARDVGNDVGTTFLELAPRLGYFVARGLALNANLQFVHSSTDAGTATRWGVGPGLTYYVSGLSHRVYPFVSGRTLFTWDHGSDPSGQGLDRSSSTSWLVSTGVLVLVARHVGLTGELYYTHDRFTVGPNTNTAESYGLQWGFAVFVN